MRCSNCGGENFDIGDLDLNVAELYLQADLFCENCGSGFVVEFGLKVEEIREVE
ncbi:hypothetical protein LCGC14_2699350 [marine sediment metagenome]|uniref:Uncharacterized protein n=1 Tax=marine sediment metagenome TaxID=412755 RepID=A0A0F9C801_9ZZZZ